MTARLSDVDKALLKQQREREREEVRNAKRDKTERDRKEAKGRGVK
jgi:hypothetical protein